MHKRVVTAAVFALTLLIALLVQGWFERVVLLFCMAVGLWEMYGAMERKGYAPVKWIGLVYCGCTALFQALRVGGIAPFDRMDVATFALALSVMLGFSVVVFSGKPDFARALATCFPLLYPGALFSLLIQLQDRTTAYVSALAMALALFTASINDVFALFGGARFGKRKLSPLISPKKTVEGAISGLIASVLFAFLVPLGFTLFAKVVPGVNPEGVMLPPLWAFALMGLCAGALSQIGDLAASIVKRWCDLKDFGTIFPGHGGMMDRFDGILFCGFAWWIFFEAFGL